MLLQRAVLFIAAGVTVAATATSQIIINEIMQNPESVGDTDGEWFELFNAGTDPVDLDGWTIADDGSNAHTIQNGGPLLVSTGEFIVLGRNADPSANGNVPVSYEYGSDFTLGNGSDQVILYSPDGAEVDRVSYDDGATFPDPSGASMELIHYELDNTIGSYWLDATTSWSGGDRGTPGEINSRFDSIPPAVVTATATIPTQVRVAFDEPVEATSAGNEANYLIVPDVGVPITAEPDTLDPTSVLLTVAPLLPGTLYTLTVIGVSDVAGNIMERDSVMFQLAGAVLPGDMIITEIMKDPAAVNDADGEWFEVYNRSAQTIDLAGWEITDGGSNVFTVQGSFPVPPAAFALFTVNTDSTTNGGITSGLMYDWGSSGTFTLGNGDDVIVIRNGSVVIDSIAYDSGTTWPDPTGASLALSDFSLDNNIGAHWTAATLREPAYTGSEGDAGSPATLGSNQSAGRSPSIQVDPDSIGHSIRAGEVVLDTLTIHNDGSADLVWSILTDDQECAWILIRDTAGTTSPAESTLVPITLDGNEVGAGVHVCHIVIASNDPLNPLITIPVTLDVSDTVRSVLVFIPDQFLPVPADGDTVDTHLILRNPGPDPLEADVWLDLDRPDSLSPRSIISPKRFTLEAGDSILKVRPLGIPSYGPAGIYTLVLTVRSYPDSLTTTSAFAFEKVADTSANQDSGDGVTTDRSQATIAQSYPNPFNPSTIITYSLQEQTSVTLTVFNLLGEVVATLVREVQEPGIHSVIWHGTDSEGRQVSSGLYIYTIFTERFTESRKMVLVR